MNIIVTGASRGIGFETVLHLAKDPKNSIICIARNAPKLQQLKKQCIELGNKHIYIKEFDLSQGNIDELVKFIRNEFSFVDVLINNAGSLIRKPFSDISQVELREIFEVNYIKPFELIQQCLPLLKRSKKAHVLNISSMAGFQGSSKFPGLSAYGSSKAAIASLTESLSAEFGKTSVRFNALALGATQTDMLAEAFPGYDAPVTAEKMGEYIADFAVSGHNVYNGSVLPVNLSNL